MKLRTRRIIMISFILAFFILGPTLIFYASGYRYDLKRNKILRTGTLMIEAKDVKNANLFLNGQLYEKPLDEKLFIYNLLPDEYEIKISKEGYHDFEKKIIIQSGLTTFAKDVILFKKNIPLQILEGDIIDFSLSPDWQKMILLEQTETFSELYSYAIELKEKKLLYRIPSSENIIRFAWAASSKKILVQIDTTFLVFNIQNLESQDIKDISKFTIDNAKWDIASDNIVYTKKDNTIYKIDIFAKTIQEIFTAGQEINSEFFIEANDLFYIQRETNQNVLYKYNSSFQTVKKVMDLSKSSNYYFVASTNNYLGLIDMDQQKLYLVQKVITDLEIDIQSSAPAKEFSAKNAIWDKDEKQILIYNDFEILTYNTENGNETFINRYGQVIKKALWYPDLLKTVILFENNLRIIDIYAENGTRNFTDIVKFDQLTTLYLDRKGEIIFFNGKIGKQQGLYKLELK